MFHLLLVSSGTLFSVKASFFYYMVVPTFSIGFETSPLIIPAMFPTCFDMLVNAFQVFITYFL